MQSILMAFEDTGSTGLDSYDGVPAYGLPINLICTVIVFYLVLKNKNMTGGQKTIWCVFGLLFGILTLLAWFIFGRKRYDKPTSPPIDPNQFNTPYQNTNPPSQFNNTYQNSYPPAPKDNPYAADYPKHPIPPLETNKKEAYPGTPIPPQKPTEAEEDSPDQ